MVPDLVMVTEPSSGMSLGHKDYLYDIGIVMLQVDYTNVCSGAYRSILHDSRSPSPLPQYKVMNSKYSTRPTLLQCQAALSTRL